MDKPSLATLILLAKAAIETSEKRGDGFGHSPETVEAHELAMWRFNEAANPSVIIALCEAYLDLFADAYERPVK